MILLTVKIANKMSKSSNKIHIVQLKKEYENWKILAVYRSKEKAERLVRIIKERDSHDLHLYCELAKLKSSSLTENQEKQLDYLLNKNLLDEIQIIEAEVK